MGLWNVVISLGSRCSALQCLRKFVASDTVPVKQKLCKSIVNIKSLKYHLSGGANVTYMLGFYCQFSVKSICVQINRLETDKQLDPKGCATHAIYRLEARWASFYANTMFVIEQSVLLLKISLIMVWISYPALSICCNMLGKRIEQFVSNTLGRHPITPAAKCIWQHPPVMTLYLPLIQIQNRKQRKEQQQQQQRQKKRLTERKQARALLSDMTNMQNINRILSERGTKRNSPHSFFHAGIPLFFHIEPPRGH